MPDLLLPDHSDDTHGPVIQKPAASDDQNEFEMLKMYALAPYRLNSPAFGLVRIADSAITIHDGSRPVNIAKGDSVFVDFVTAGRDPEKFPEPKEIRLDRPEED